MTAWDVSSRLLLAVGLTACYDVPKPDCGFRCGPSTGCPDGYTCASDHRCHRDGSDPGLVCATTDAGSTSPRIVSSVPAPGATIAPTTTLSVTFDVDVAGVDATSFAVFLLDPEQLVPGDVGYDSLSRSATWSTAGGLPPNANLVMFLSQDIHDPITMSALTTTSITFSTGD